MAHLPDCRFLDEGGNLLWEMSGFYSTPQPDSFVTINTVEYKVESVTLKLKTEDSQGNGAPVRTSVSSTVLDVVLSVV